MGSHPAEEACGLHHARVPCHLARAAPGYPEVDDRRRVNLEVAGEGRLTEFDRMAIEQRLATVAAMGQGRVAAADRMGDVAVSAACGLSACRGGRFH